MTCRYTLTGPDGQRITVTGIPALKQYLAGDGVLAHLLPDVVANIPAFKRTPIQKSVSRIGDTRHVAMIERVTSKIASTVKNPPKISIVYDLSDPSIDERVREADRRQRMKGATGEPEGFYLDGTVYLLSSQIKSEADASRVTLHEMLGHYGLRGLFGEGLRSVLQQIIALRKADVKAMAKRRGLDMDNPEEAMEAAEEVLAHMAEKTPTAGFVQRAIAAIRTWLRKNVPGMSGLKLSDAEIIRDFVLPARAFVEQGAQAGKDMADAAFSRRDVTATDAFNRWFGDSKVVDGDGKPLVVYHATENDFSKFKMSKTGLFGKGAYFTASADDANNYTGEAGSIYPVYLSINRPYKINARDSWDTLYQQVVGREPANPGKEMPSTSQAKEIMDALRAYGHDGLEVRFAGMDGETHYVAFDQAQIKSATGNNGDFNGANPDIRFSRAAPKPEDTSLTPPDQGLLRKVQAAVQDNKNRVKQVQERITWLTGKALAEYANYYMAEANRPGRIAARLEDGRRNLFEPMMDRLAKSGHTMEQLSELLHAMHAQERNESRGKLHPEHSDFYLAMADHSIVGASGMSTAKANEILAKYKGNKELHRLASDARRIARATLDMKLAYGLIDKETHETLTKAYKNYVPLKGNGEYGPKIKSAIGHGERDEFILENISRDFEQSIVVGEKNLARQFLLQMILENPDSDLWSVGVPPKGRRIVKEKGFHVVFVDGQRLAQFKTQEEAERAAEMYSSMFGEPPEMYQAEGFKRERVQEYVKPLQDNEVMVYIDGQPVRIQIYDEALARQIRPLDQGQMNVILEKMRDLNRYLSKIYTGYNPAFIVRNTVRDAMTGTVNILGNEGIGTAARAWMKYPQALAALTQYASTGKAPNSEVGKMLDEYRMHGGKTGASWMSDLETQGRELQRMFDDAYGASGYMKDGKPGKAAWIAGRKIVGGMAHSIEVLNQATENALRLSLYMAMRDQGSTPGEAAQAAKSVTVDFDRKGSMTGALGAIYLFFNPAVQGTANAIKTLAKGKHKEQAWAALGALALLGMYAAGQGLDDDEDRWLGEGWETRSKNFMLNIGGHTIKVPVSLEFAPFYAFGVAMEEARRGATSKMAAACHMVSSMIGAYFPLQGAFNSESDNHLLDLGMAATPTALKPLAQSGTNRNVFGSQIVPENEFTKDRPDNLKMYRGTKGSPYDVTAQAISEAGVEWFGAGRYENDITKVSPETLKMLWRTYTGGLGQFIADAGGLANVFGQDAGNVETSDAPIVKDFVKTNDVKAIRGRFYELSKEAREASQEFSQAKKAGDNDAMDAIMNRPEKAELLGFDRMIRYTQSAAAKLRDEMADINADKSLSLAEKRQRLKALEKDEEALYREAIGVFK